MIQRFALALLEYLKLSLVIVLLAYFFIRSKLSSSTGSQRSENYSNMCVYRAMAPCMLASEKGLTIL